MCKFNIGTTFNNNEVFEFDDSKRISTLVLGSSGSGKSTGATNFLFNENIAKKSTYIILNGKEQETIFENKLIKNAKPYINLSINSKNKYKLNPFSRMATIEQVSILKEFLVSMLDFSSSAYYKDLSISIINYVLEASFMAKEALYYDTFIDKLTPAGIKDLALKCKKLDVYLMQPDLSDKMVTSTLISLKSRYYCVFSLAGSYIYINSKDKNAKEIDIIDTLNNNVSVEVSFNSMAYPDLSHALGLQILLFINQFVDNKSPAQHVEIIMDEVTAYISGSRSLQLIDNLISRGRSYKTRTSILGQSLHGFVNLVDDTNSFISNLSSNLTTLMAFESGCVEDLEFIANFIGSEDIPFYTRQVKYNGSKPQFTDIGTYKLETKHIIGGEQIKHLSTKYAPYYCVFMNKRQSSRPAIINIR